MDYSKMKEFDLEELLGNSQKNRKKHYSYGALDNNSRFLLLCSKIKNHIDEEWLKEQNSDNTELLMERHKNAILGKPTEVNYLKDKIRDYLKANKLEKEQYPSWYKNLTDAVFHENWGIAGIAQWMDIPDSSSAKIIGDRIYFFIGGKQVLKEQRISSKRFEQLRQALMLRDETKRLDENYSELYMETGERVTVYTGKRVAEGQSAMVFRKYIVNVLTFEEQARRGTIPGEFIPAMEALVKCGVRVAFTGPVRSGKSTMLLTWQLYENPELEGVLIQTDPEIRIHEVMPKAPIMSLIAEGEGLFKISSEILKSDADYLIVQVLTSKITVKRGSEIIYTGENLQNVSNGEKKDFTIQTKRLTETGTYTVTITTADQHSASVTATTASTVNSLSINGYVDHTATWKSNWAKYNSHMTQNGKQAYGADTFFTGEKYLLRADTTSIASGSEVTALKVSVKLAERTYSPVWLSKQSQNSFIGEMWNEDMRGTRWRGTYATFLFSVTYSNGTVKTDSVKTFIVEDDYWRIRMAF